VERDHEQPWSNEFEEVLRRHLLYYTEDAPLDPEALLVEYGLDSMAAITLMLDLESTLSVRFSEEALTSESFATAAALWRAAQDASAESSDS